MLVDKGVLPMKRFDGRIEYAFTNENDTPILVRERAEDTTKSKVLKSPQTYFHNATSTGVEKQLKVVGYIYAFILGTHARYRWHMSPKVFASYIPGNTMAVPIYTAVV